MYVDILADLVHDGPLLDSELDLIDILQVMVGYPVILHNKVNKGDIAFYLACQCLSEVFLGVR